MKPFPAWCLGFIMALTFFWVGLTASGFDWSRQWRLSQAASEVDAFIIRTEPHNHCLARYEFEVNGKQYRGSGSGPGCSAMIGTKLHVYYLADDPTFSTLKKPGDDLSSMIVGPIFLSVIAGFITMKRMCWPGK